MKMLVTLAICQIDEEQFQLDLRPSGAQMLIKRNQTANVGRGLHSCEGHAKTNKLSAIISNYLLFISQERGFFYEFR